MIEQAKGVIFDMDGTMFDTEVLNNDAWGNVGEALEIDKLREIALETIGLNSEDSEAVFYKHLGNDIDYCGMRKIKRDYVENYIKENGMPIKSGLIELLMYLKDNNIKIALASSTEEERVSEYIKIAKVDTFFDALACGDMVTNGKPAPDIFIKAAELLNVNTNECIALEDSPKGIMSAYKAGCIPVAIPDLIKLDEETKKMLYQECNSLLEVIDLLE